MRLPPACLFLGLLVAAGPVWSDTFVVDTTADTNDAICEIDCSLREAILLANQNPGADVIVIPAGDPYVLTISGRLEDLAMTGDLDIYGELTIMGAGANDTIVDAGALDRVFDVRDGATVTFSGLTIRNGDTGTSQGENFGGGIYAENAVSLTVRDSVIADCRVQSAGGGIFADNSPITVTNTVARGNQAGTGGGILISGAPATLIGVTFEQNEASYGGGGLAVRDFEPEEFNEVTVLGSTIDANTATARGGGIHAQGDLLLVTDTVITGNDGGNDGGGVYVEFDSQVEIRRSTIAGNETRMDIEFAGDGGGIAVAGMLLLEDSTVSGNTANNKGGGVSVQANHATIRNSTISGNTALGFSGGGIDMGEATLELIYSTVVDNAAQTGDNLRTSATTPSVELQSSIVALPAGGHSSCQYTSGTTPVEVVTLGGNVDDDDSCRLSAPDDRPDGDPALGPLADNGGPTLTHLPMVGSDAIDFGTGAACPPTDQRGYGRNVDGDGDEQAACDSGAVELLPDSGGLVAALATLGALARGRNRVRRNRRTRTFRASR